MNGAANDSNQKTEAPTLEIKRLSADCSRAAFSCGNGDIDKWFREKAQKHHNGMRCRVATGHLNGNKAPVGFYAACMKLESVSALPRSLRQSLSWPGGRFPALHLQYMAVVRDMQRCGHGTILMGSLIDDFYEVATRSGIVALTVVAIDSKTAEFYQKMGFVRFGDVNATQPNLFLPAASVIKARESL